jgi:hypothetical protein
MKQNMDEIRLICSGIKSNVATEMILKCRLQNMIQGFSRFFLSRFFPSDTSLEMKNATEIFF